MLRCWCAPLGYSAIDADGWGGDKNASGWHRPTDRSVHLSRLTALSDNRYQLIDFGDGRKLESIGGYVIDRPSPAATWSRRLIPQRWSDADAIYDVATRAWTFHRPWPTRHGIDCDGFTMPVAPTPFGHIGLFPEQADNWRWLRACDGKGEKALNLFGYTGASTMAMLGGGFEVAHVDAAKPNVQAVRHAATASGMTDPPIRYLVDDAAKFAARDVRRGRRYHTIVLDPPAYGHAPGGRAWRLDRDLWPLMTDCLQLLAPESFRLLVTGHSPEVDDSVVIEFLDQSKHIDMTAVTVDAGRSGLVDQSGRTLDCGFYVRVESTGSTS